MVHHQSDAEDIMQQTSSEMWRLFDRFEKGTNFASWGIAIAKFKILDYRKKQSKRRLFLAQEVYEKVTMELHNTARNPDKRKNALQGCLRKLKQSDRKILSLHYEEGLTYLKISEKLNLSKSGIYKVMARIHTSLQKCIEQTLLIWDVNE
jgi:RNA polymerase sigma-70 factor (ECF subfamily)